MQPRLWAAASSPHASILMRTVDLDLGETQEVELSDGSTARVKLVQVEEERDQLRGAIRSARAQVEVNGASATLTSANYRLPVTVGGVQIDCPVTRGYASQKTRENVWALEKDARFRLWPKDSPWIQPGTFMYPVKQRWLASDTQMANEPVFVDGGEVLNDRSIYYHYGLDFGGAEGLVEVIAPVSGLVVTAAGDLLPEHTNSPAAPRYDVVYLLDERGWYYRCSHFMSIEVKAGQRVRMGQRLGWLGKEGGSGGWAHFHFDITSRQPSGQWGIQDAYAYAWQAYQQEYRPALLAVARPHHLGEVGERIVLDGTRSWSKTGSITRYDWRLTDGAMASGAKVERVYDQPGTYSEVLRITDSAGQEAYDFAVVQIFDKAQPTNLPPAIHAACYPNQGLRPNEEITFKVRTFRTTQPSEEVWDFGDGSPPVKTHSDGNARVHAKDGYAVLRHRYAKPGHYLVKVEHANSLGQKATAHLWIEVEPPFVPKTRISLQNGQWHINDEVTYPGARAEGLLMNVRMVNSVFEDLRKPEFDPEANTQRFLRRIPDYARQGVRAFTLCLQGGMPGYEGALNSAFYPDGTLRLPYLERVERVIEACDRLGMAVILGCYYQRQDQVLADETAVRDGVVNVARWIQRRGFSNVMLEIANEFDHDGFDHDLIESVSGEVELIELARKTMPGLLVSTSGLGHGRFPGRLAEAADFLLIHYNGVPVKEIPSRIRALKKHGKPIVCNEDDKTGEEAVQAAELSVANHASWGLMLKEINQYFPLRFNGASDAPEIYGKLKALTSP